MMPARNSISTICQRFFFILEFPRFHHAAEGRF
jgi:hypothetical protein